MVWVGRPISKMAMGVGMEEWAQQHGSHSKDWSSCCCCCCWLSNLLSTETNNEIPFCHYLLKSPPITDGKLTTLKFFHSGKASNSFWQKSMHILSEVLPFLLARPQPEPLCKGLQNVWSMVIGSHTISSQIRGLALSNRRNGSGSLTAGPIAPIILHYPKHWKHAHTKHAHECSQWHYSS